MIRGYTGQFRFDREGLRTLFDITTLDLTEGGFVPVSQSRYFVCSLKLHYARQN